MSRTTAVSLAEKVIEQIERTGHLIRLIPNDVLDWRPPLQAGAMSAPRLLGHLLECAAGICAALYAIKPDRLEHFLRLRELPVNHDCTIPEACERIADYAGRIEEGFSLISDEDLQLRLPTVFVPDGETAVTIILGNLEHLINHKYQLFSYIKMMGVEAGTADLYRLRGPDQSKQEVTRTYLQMLSPEELNGSGPPDGPIQINRVNYGAPSFYRYLYAEVGRRYHWDDRLGWSDTHIDAHYVRADVSLWVLYYDGSPAGYFELERHEDGSVEIAYFGLLKEFLGRGLGKWLLTCATRQAWESGANRVWLHTCTLDDPAAMPNYLRRGFTPFRNETYFITGHGTNPG